MRNGECCDFANSKLVVGTIFYEDILVSYYFAVYEVKFKPKIGFGVTTRRERLPLNGPAMLVAMTLVNNCSIANWY